MGNKGVKICSACLLGIKCRYDGEARINKKLLELSKNEILIPVCQEQLGGLTTPREPSEQRGGKVFTASGRDVSAEFAKGAAAVLEIASLYNIKEAILKSKSPSCGCGKIYDGTFFGKLIDGDGVTAALLKERGIKVISDDNI